MSRAPLLSRLTVLAALLVASLVLVAPAGSTPPRHVSYPVDVSYEIPELSEICGVEVWFRLSGTFKGTLTRDAGGVITGEFDSQPNTTQTFSSPDTGRSFSFKFSTTFHNKYPDGIEPGDRVVAKISGFLEKLPGLPAWAGHGIFPNGEVLFVDDGGVPIVDYGEPTQDVGRKYTGEQADAAICAALAR